MRIAARLLYSAVARLVSAAAVLVPPGPSKASIAFRARRGIARRYARWGAEHRARTKPLLWVHAPSVGEGLQARPVLALMRTRHPETQLAYTFFSPSAEEFSRSVDVDFRDYLPFDSPPDMGAALDALRPKALVFSKLDVWPELVAQARRRSVRLGMISATLSTGSGRQGFFANMLLRDAYAALDAVGAVDGLDAGRLVELGVRPEAVSVTGDTRFDQVWQRAEGVNWDSVLITRLASERPTIVAGSTWPSDEERLLKAFRVLREKVPEARLILAPHEPFPTNINPIVEWIEESALRGARIDEAAAANADVVIVDRFGVLGDLYALADVAFVGGGFHDAGLHSVLEPAAFGAPVLFGPRHHRSRDAGILLEAQAAQSVRDDVELAGVLTAWLQNEELRRAMGARARATVERNKGAAERSLLLVERLLSS